MKKIIGIAAVITMITISASAQKPSGGDQHPNFHGKHHRPDLAKKLNFSDAQKQQLKKINEEFRAKRKDLDKNESITVKEMRDRSAALVQEQRTAFQNLLTPEQKTKMEELKKQAIAKREAMQTKRLDKMKTNLGLSDDQTAKIKNLEQNFQGQMKKLHEDNTIERSSKREQAMALIEQHKKDMEGVFTPDQLNKLKESRKDRMDKRM